MSWGFPGFVCMKVLKSDAEDEILVVTRWQDKGSFDAWVGSEECCTPSALAAPAIVGVAVPSYLLAEAGILGLAVIGLLAGIWLVAYVIP